MTSISMIVPGRAVPKARPRTVDTGTGKVNTYTPGRSVDYAHIVHYAARQQMWQEDFKKIFKPHPVELDILFILKGKAQPTCRPDVNNLASNVLDGLQGAWIEDDCQVVKLRATKMKGAEEGTLIRLAKVQESECQLELAASTA